MDRISRRRVVTRKESENVAALSIERLARNDDPAEKVSPLPGKPGLNRERGGAPAKTTDTQRAWKWPTVKSGSITASAMGILGRTGDDRETACTANSRHRRCAAGLKAQKPRILQVVPLGRKPGWPGRSPGDGWWGATSFPFGHALLQLFTRSGP